ncbi:MAG: chemotaxis protein CheC [Hymenobacter sp.]
MQRTFARVLAHGRVESLDVNELQESLLLEISNIITGALVTQLANILKANIYGAPPVAPRGDIADAMQNLLPELQLQPLIFSVITQFSDKDNMVELPLMLFFDRETFQKILEIIRSYDFLGSQMSA